MTAASRSFYRRARREPVVQGVADYEVAPSHLIWVDHFGCPRPQALYQAPGTKPFLDAGIVGRVLATHSTKPEDAGLELDGLALRYPAPSPTPNRSEG